MFHMNALTPLTRATRNVRTHCSNDQVLEGLFRNLVRQVAQAEARAGNKEVGALQLRLGFRRGALAFCPVSY